MTPLGGGSHDAFTAAVSRLVSFTPPYVTLTSLFLGPQDAMASAIRHDRANCENIEGLFRPGPRASSWHGPCSESELRSIALP